MRSLWCIQFSVLDTGELKLFWGPERSPGLSKNGPLGYNTTLFFYIVTFFSRFCCSNNTVHIYYTEFSKYVA